MVMEKLVKFYKNINLRVNLRGNLIKVSSTSNEFCRIEITRETDSYSNSDLLPRLYKSYSLSLT